MTINEQAYAVLNNIVSGLKGMTGTMSIPIVQIEEDVILERALVIKEYLTKDLLKNNAISQTMPSLKLNLKELSRSDRGLEKYPWCEIPQLITDFGDDCIIFAGSTDRAVPFQVYLNNNWIYHQYKRRNGHKPFLYIDPSPNKQGFTDCFVMNAPLIKEITITGVFRDPREVDDFICNRYHTNKSDYHSTEYDDDSHIATETIKRLSEKYIRYYRQLQLMATPNDQMIKP